jgi:choline kinase
MSGASRVRAAVILAAGRGARMGAKTQAVSKSVLPLGGTTLLGRQLRQMAGRGVERVTVVVGYQASELAIALRGAADVEVTFVHNADWATTGSGWSLVQARDAMESGEPVLLTHGDIVYADGVLDGSLADAADGRSVTAADASWTEQTGDEVLVWSSGGELLGLRKGSPLGAHDATGEYIGLSVLSPQFASDFVRFCAARSRRENYELPVLGDFVGSGRGSCRVSYFWDLPWVNVNYVEDLEFAERTFGRGR